MVWLCQTVLYPIRLANHVETHLSGMSCVPVSGLVGELDSIVGQDRVDPIRDHFQQVFQELPRGSSVGFRDKLTACVVVALP